MPLLTHSIQPSLIGLLQRPRSGFQRRTRSPSSSIGPRPIPSLPSSHWFYGTNVLPSGRIRLAIELSGSILGRMLHDGLNCLSTQTFELRGCTRDDREEKSAGIRESWSSDRKFEILRGHRREKARKRVERGVLTLRRNQVKVERKHGFPPPASAGREIHAPERTCARLPKGNKKTRRIGRLLRLYFPKGGSSSFTPRRGRLRPNRRDGAGKATLGWFQEEFPSAERKTRCGYACDVREFGNGCVRRRDAERNENACAHAYPRQRDEYVRVAETPEHYLMLNSNRGQG